MLISVAYSLISVQAQAPVAASQSVSDIPKFDVIAIKPNPHSDQGCFPNFTADGFSVRGCNLTEIVRFAFVVKDDRLVINLPADKGALYDIQAKVAENDLARFQQLSNLQKRPMVQALLADRFHLKFHWISKELPVYALVIDKNGLKLAEAKPGTDGKIHKGLRMTGRYTAVATGWTSADFFGLMTQMSGRYVIDRTGLKGAYDFKLQFSPYDPTVDGKGDAPFDGPIIFTALREQLGLALEPSTAMLDAIVIDHVEVPTLN